MITTVSSPYLISLTIGTPVIGPSWPVVALRSNRDILPLLSLLLIFAPSRLFPPLTSLINTLAVCRTLIITSACLDRIMRGFLPPLLGVIVPLCNILVGLLLSSGPLLINLTSKSWLLGGSIVNIIRIRLSFIVTASVNLIGIILKVFFISPLCGINNITSVALLHITVVLRSGTIFIGENFYLVPFTILIENISQASIISVMWRLLVISLLCIYDTPRSLLILKGLILLNWLAQILKSLFIIVCYSLKGILSILLRATKLALVLLRMLLLVNVLARSLKIILRFQTAVKVHALTHIR